MMRVVSEAVAQHIEGCACDSSSVSARSEVEDLLNSLLTHTAFVLDEHNVGAALCFVFVCLPIYDFRHDNWHQQIAAAVLVGINNVAGISACEAAKIRFCDDFKFSETCVERDMEWIRSKPSLCIDHPYFRDSVAGLRARNGLERAKKSPREHNALAVSKVVHAKCRSSSVSTTASSCFSTSSGSGCDVFSI